MSKAGDIGACALLALTLTLPAGCQRCDSDREPEGEGAGQAGPVLARVGGEPIVRADLEASASDALGAVGQAALDGPNADALIEGVAARRAMAMWHERTLREQDPRALERIDRQARAHRERLLAGALIDARVGATAPDEASIRAYYDAHPERFGARTVRVHDLLVADLGEDPGAHASRLTTLGALAAKPDWAAGLTELARPAWLSLRKGGADLGALHPSLRKGISRLSQGQTGEVIRVGQRAYVARVTRLEERPGVRLEDARAAIVDALAPAARRDAIRALRAEALEEMNYTRVGGQNP